VLQLLRRGCAPARPQSVRHAVRRLAVSRFVSMAGTDATGVAIGFAMYDQTRSTAWLSLSLMITIGAGAVLAPFGGMIGDRFDRRRLMIGAELTACAVFLALALTHSPVALLALGMVATAIGTVFGPTSGAAIASIAGDRHLTWANSVIATGSTIGKTAGRMIAGGLIAAVGVSSVFLLDALTFVISALLIASVRRHFSEAPAAREQRRTEQNGAWGGLSFLAADPTVRLLTASACISVFATSFSMTAEVPLVFELGLGAIGLGALTACWTAGMALGSWFAGRALHRGNEATGVLVGRLAMATGIGLVAVAPSLAPLLACYLLGGLAGGFMGVAAQSLTMRSVPDHLRARVFGAIDACRNTAFGLGVLGAGALVGLLGARPVYAAVGLTMALGGVPLARLVIRLGGLRPLRLRVVRGAPAPALPD
jgi:MFS family permease